MIIIIDYGSGNINAFVNIFTELNISFRVAKAADDFRGVSKIILPGVGSFDWAITKFKCSGMFDIVEELVKVNNVPIIGVCVGMQMMFDSSDEGRMPGLGWISGHVASLRNREGSSRLQLPHMGWNSVETCREDDLFRGIVDLYFYFLHSYSVIPKLNSDILGETVYGNKIVAAIRSSNFFGTQFHPEKSHQSGMRLLNNFAKL